MKIHWALFQLIVSVEMDIRENFVKRVSEFSELKCQVSFLLWIEYFQCQTNGRFMDRYNCEKGKYFECVHQGQGMNC